MTTTNMLIKLVKGTRTLDLNSGRYKAAAGFVPPPLQEVANIASGTSANRRGGGILIGKRARNRSFSFDEHVIGSSEAEIRRAINDIQWFLDQAGDESEPLYLQFNGVTDVGFEPLWGQYGASRYYEILFGNVRISRRYSDSDLRARGLPNSRINLRIKPFAVGLRQRVGSATGGILEDTIGATDGISRGVIIPEATTNKMTNPIFGHSTYDSGWTTLAGIISAENTDPKFITHGKSSAKLVCISATNRRFTQNINVGNTNTHEISCYVKLPDGGVVSTANTRLYYGAGVTETYTLIGDGWYRITASVTGINANTNTGISMINGHTAYVDGFQIEEKAYATPMAHGDMLGCAWTGTAHASTSTRTAARLRTSVSDALDVAEGTIRVVWKAPVANTDYSTNVKLFETDTVTFRIYFNGTDDKWYFQDGTNTISSAAQTFSAKDVIILHAVYGPGSLKIYKNGSEIATGSTYTPPSPPTDIYIGSTSGAALHTNGTFMDFTTYARAMTATEVSDDYTNIVQLTNDDQRVSPIPWLWTKDGDDIVDNHNDSGEDNFCVVGGIPGSAEAETSFELRFGGTYSENELYISLGIYDEFIDPTGNLYEDKQGVADAGVTSGGEYEQVGLTTTEARTEITGAKYQALVGKEFYIFARWRELTAFAADVIARMTLRLSKTTVVQGEDRIVTSDASYRGYLFGPLVFPDLQSYLFDEDFDIAGALDNWIIPGVGIRVSTGTEQLRFDYLTVWPRPLIKIINSGGVRADVAVHLKGRQSIIRLTASGIPDIGVVSIVGDVIELAPDKINILQSMFGENEGVNVIGNTMTYHAVRVKPRWALL